MAVVEQNNVTKDKLLAQTVIPTAVFKVQLSKS